jgi:hypothetical protein
MLAVLPDPITRRALSRDADTLPPIRHEYPLIHARGLRSRQGGQPAIIGFLGERISRPFKQLAPVTPLPTGEAPQFIGKLAIEAALVLGCGVHHTDADLG